MIETTVMTAEPLITQIKRKAIDRIVRLRRSGVASPKLVALLIGKDAVSRTYVDLKRKDCADVGIVSEVKDLSGLPKDSAKTEILKVLAELNLNSSVSAIIPQIPFDGLVAEEDVFSKLNPDKDVDGMTPFRLGLLLRREYSFDSSLLPCTPKGIVLLLKYYGVHIEGAEIAIIGRGLLVGEPLRKLLQDLNATVTCYHTQSKHLKERIKEADIIVAAAGRPPEIYGDSGIRITSQMVKQGSIVIGAGVRKWEANGKMLFDVDTRSLKGHCSYITPNVGGVGAMTRAVLIENTVIASELQSRLLLQKASSM